MSCVSEKYNQFAEAFCKRTVSIDLRETRDRFSKYLKPGATILDAGCGSGRDTKAFLEEGFLAEAIDGSEEIVKFASLYLGKPISRLRFEEMEFYECFDGIWARASLVSHEPTDLKKVFRRFIQAVKPKGYWYFSFKYGCGIEMVRDVPFYLQSEESLKLFIGQFPELNIKEIWITSGRIGERTTPTDWINCIVQRTS